MGLPSSGETVWHVAESANSTRLIPIRLRLTFNPEALPRDQELAYRKVLNHRTPGLQNFLTSTADVVREVQGFLDDSVPMGPMPSADSELHGWDSPSEDKGCLQRFWRRLSQATDQILD